MLVNIKVPTSGLWEELIARAVREADAGLLVNTDNKQAPAVTVFSGINKKPDIRVWRKPLPGQQPAHNPILVLDGKYKDYKERFVDTSMPDQYQMYAYANICQSPVFMVYPDEPDGQDSPSTAPKVFDRNGEVILNRTAGTSFVMALRTKSAQGEKADETGQIVGVAALPFPQPGALSITENPSVIAEWLRKMYETGQTAVSDQD